ncbi:universal stress protein [Boothiomyces macroporosus]|uniref:Universal stress protein n=1 Tax=Boothiomyces macroporosus TaxID=261099 RepID=A0AAD5UE92_9FUNG|nr:universal stress protein [Boothiomyces macroporosus]
MPTYEELVIGTAENFTGKRTLLLPVDVSETAYRAVVWASEHLVNPDTDNVVLVNCREVVYPLVNLLVGNSEYRQGMKAASQDDIVTFEKESKQLSHAVLARCSKVLQDKKVHVKGISIVGDPRHGLTDYIAEHKPDLVVLASQGKSALKAAYLGSVSNYLLHHSKSAVTIIPHSLVA